MSTYVISTCFLKNIESKEYFTDVLLKFTQKNSLRVGIDKDKIIIDIYNNIAENDPRIAYWLFYMTIEPSKFETLGKLKVPIESELQIFLQTCKLINNQKKIIIDSCQKLLENFPEFQKYTFRSEKQLEFENEIIFVLEKEDALEEFQTKNIFISDSIVAHNGSIINNSGIFKKASNFIFSSIRRLSEKN